MQKFIYLIGAILVAACAWGAYWYLGASAKEDGIETWLADRSSEGWIAESSGISAAGFPNRHDVTVRDLRLADPQSGWAWTAPNLDILSLSYQPDQVIVIWPDTQKISSPEQTITATSSEMKASVTFKPNTDHELERFTVTVDGLSLKSSQGWQSSLSRAVLAARPSELGPFAYDLAFDGQDFKPAADFKQQIDGSNLLPETFEKMNIQSVVEFTGAWNKSAIEGPQPQIKRIKLNKAAARWGALDLQAGGDVSVDAEGYPTGRVTIRAKNWKNMIAMARDAGAIAPEMAATLESGLSLLALLSGGKDSIEAPLSFRNRTISIGPVPIGTAPRLKIGRSQ